MNHYSDAEGTDVLIDKTQYKSHTINTYHLRQDVSNHGPFTSINYWKNEISQGLIVNSITTIVLLDSIGNIIFKEEYNKKMSPPAISPDGQYLMIAFSGEETVNNAGIKSQPDGFELWQTNPKKLLHREENGDPDMWIAGVNYSPEAELVSASYSHPNSKDKMRTTNVFDPKNNELKIYTTTRDWYNSQNIFFTKNKRYRTWKEIKSELNLTNRTLNHGK